MAQHLALVAVLLAAAELHRGHAARSQMQMHSGFLKSGAMKSNRTGAKKTTGLGLNPMNNFFDHVMHGEVPHRDPREMAAVGHQQESADSPHTAASPSVPRAVSPCKVPHEYTLYPEIVLQAAQWAYQKAYSKDYIYDFQESTHQISAPAEYDGVKIDETLAKEWVQAIAPKCRRQGMVVRPNHAVDNAVRKALIMPYIVKAYEQTKCFKSSIFQKNLESEYLLMMQIAAIFESAGRESEVGFGDNAKIFHKFRARTFAFLKDFVDENPNVAEIVKKKVDPRCGKTTVYDRVFNAFTRMYMAATHKENVHMKILLEMMHDVELIRCYGNQKMPAKYDDMKEQLGAFTNVVVRIDAKMIAAHGQRVVWAPQGMPWLKSNDNNCDKLAKAGNNPEAAIAMAAAVLPPLETFEPEGEESAPPASKPDVPAVCRAAYPSRGGFLAASAAPAHSLHSVAAAPRPQAQKFQNKGHHQRNRGKRDKKKGKLHFKGKRGKRAA